MQEPKIYADFQNADAKGRVRLNCDGTLQDLARQKIQLREGLALALYSDDTDADGKPDELLVVGVVEFSVEEQMWVASVNWPAIHHASDEKRIAAPTVRGATRHVG
jgi:hypothetical protein